jgi:cob(I)alamin adenosyltransferase
MMKIYTKTGDKGETGIIGKRVKKYSPEIEALGSVDELNASIGVTVSLIGMNKGSELKKFIPIFEDVQNSLFSLGAVIAGSKTKTDFKTRTQNIEKHIDKLQKDLKPLQNFILPGGDILAANIHLNRVICRRAERRFVEYIDGLTDPVEELLNARKYLNRFSDLLFVMARWVNQNKEIGDTMVRYE